MNYSVGVYRKSPDCRRCYLFLVFSRHPRFRGHQWFQVSHGLVLTSVDLEGKGANESSTHVGRGKGTNTIEIGGTWW